MSFTQSFEYNLYFAPKPSFVLISFLLDFRVFSKNIRKFQRFFVFCFRFVVSMFFYLPMFSITYFEQCLQGSALNPGIQGFPMFSGIGNEMLDKYSKSGIWDFLTIWDWELGFAIKIWDLWFIHTKSGILETQKNWKFSLPKIPEKLQK